MIRAFVMRRDSAFPRHALRVRLVVLVSLLIITAVSLLSVVSVAILRQKLVEQAENALYLSSESATSRIDSELVAAGDISSSWDRFAPTPPPDGFYVVTGDDIPPLTVYFGLDYSFRELGVRETQAIRQQAGAPDEVSTIEVPGLGSYLVMATQWQAADGATLTVVSGVGLTESTAVVGMFIVWEIAIGIAVAAATAVIGYRVVRGALKPLERVVAVADRVVQTPLSSGEVARQERVPLARRYGGSEADRVARALNRLLEHVESSLNARHQTEESMRRFIAEASHELRNPLASIRGYADFYANADQDTAQVSNALVRINAEATRMSALVEDLLLLTRLDANPTLRHDEVDLSQLVVETVSDARFAYADHKWQISLAADSTTVVGDEDAIRQILLNLTANAGHHTPPGTIVTVGVSTRADSTEIVVRDNGPGIPVEALPTLFDRFTQARSHESPSTRDTTTVGLGLAIVHALAAAAGYAVTVDSDSEGTRFTLRIPAPAVQA